MRPRSARPPALMLVGASFPPRGKRRTPTVYGVLFGLLETSQCAGLTGHRHLGWVWRATSLEGRMRHPLRAVNSGSVASNHIGGIDAHRNESLARPTMASFRRPLPGLRECFPTRYETSLPSRAVLSGFGRRRASLCHASSPPEHPPSQPHAEKLPCILLCCSELRDAWGCKSLPPSMSPCWVHLDGRLCRCRLTALSPQRVAGELESPRARRRSPDAHFIGATHGP